MHNLVRTALAAAFCAAGATGCASVTSGSTQPIFVATNPVAGATCTLSNGRGRWSVVSPGSVTVEKSVTVIKAVCTKPGWQDGVAYLTPRVPAMAQAGMMLPYVGIVSAAVDGSTGAGNEYPDAVAIAMKENQPVAAAAAPPTAIQPAAGAQR